MINGISSAGGYPASFITKIQPATPRTPAATVENDAPPPTTAEPSGDQGQLAQEHTVLNLASRQFEQLLPAIETANADVE